MLLVYHNFQEIRMNLNCFYLYLFNWYLYWYLFYWYTQIDCTERQGTDQTCSLKPGSVLTWLIYVINCHFEFYNQVSLYTWLWNFKLLFMFLNLLQINQKIRLTGSHFIHIALLQFSQICCEKCLFFQNLFFFVKFRHESTLWRSSPWLFPTAVKITNFLWAHFSYESVFFTTT